MHGKSHGIFASPLPPSSNSMSPHLTIEPLCSAAYPVVSLLEPSKNRKGNSKPPLPRKDPGSPRLSSGLQSAGPCFYITRM